ncbi:MAG: hypothetical protein AN484_27050, partial [Aphanizomenon flos-aquae WA102]
AALWGTLFQIALSPLRWADNTARDIADRVTEGMEANAAKECERGQRQREEAVSLYEGATKMLADITGLRRAPAQIRGRDRSPSPGGDQ